MTGVVNRAGAKLRMAYDSRNRLLSRTWSDGTPGAEFTYDAAGRVLSIVNANSALSYSYDDAGRLLSETQALAGQPQAHTVSYGWDEDGRPAALGYPSGLEVAYAYGARGLMSGITAGGMAVAGYTYDADGRRTGKTLGNGAGSTWVYDGASQVLGIGHANGGGVFASREYAYDPVGRRTSMTSRQPGYGPLPDEYLHDPLDQIAGVRYAVAGGVPGRTVDYVHDAVGNRQQVTEDGLATAYSVNDLNQYTAVGGEALTYSANGNLAGMPGAAFSYDAQNRLVHAVNGSNTVAFAYDGRNRCVARTVNGATTWMVWDDWSLIEERDGSGAAQAAYIHGPQIDEVLARIAGESVLLYHEDALGSIVALTDLAGNVVEQYRYDVFGQPSVFDAAGQPLPASAVGNRFLFTGREWIPALGLYDFRNRMYSPVLGRWLQPDPIGFEAGDVNLYRYCGNCTSLLVDSIGLAGMFPPGFWGTRTGAELGREIIGYHAAVKQGVTRVKDCEEKLRELVAAHYSHHLQFAGQISLALRNMEGEARAWAVGETIVAGLGLMEFGVATARGGLEAAVSGGPLGAIGGGVLVGVGIEQIWYGMDMVMGAAQSMN